MIRPINPRSSIPAPPPIKSAAAAPMSTKPRQEQKPASAKPSQPPRDRPSDPVAAYDTSQDLAQMQMQVQLTKAEAVISTLNAGIIQLRQEHDAEVAELRTKLINSAAQAVTANAAYEALLQQKIELGTDVVALRHDLEVAESTATTQEPSALEILNIAATAKLHEGFVIAICKITYPSPTEDVSLALPIKIDLNTARRLLRKVKEGIAS